MILFDQAMKMFTPMAGRVAAAAKTESEGNSSDMQALKAELAELRAQMAKLKDD
jgi:polyhydroxyalkanoate synthesis regulator protein